MRVVQLPSRLWIGNYEFELRVIQQDDPINATLAKVDQLSLKAEDGLMLSGPEHYAIWLSAGLPPRRRLEIVLHEITHALNWLMDIKDTRKYVHAPEEDIAERHGRAWSAFWLENPRFEKWMSYTLYRIRLDQRKGTPDVDAAPVPGHS